MAQRWEGAAGKACLVGCYYRSWVAVAGCPYYKACYSWNCLPVGPYPGCKLGSGAVA